jgi:hypothetical protein
MKGHPLVDWVQRMRETLRGNTTDADMSIWTETVMERLDFVFMDSIKNTAHIGLSTTAGAGDLGRYHMKLIDNLATQWRQMTDLHRWALGKITFLLTFKQDEKNIPLPLLCPALFTALEKVYSQYPEALKEVSRQLPFSYRPTRCSARLILRSGFGPGGQNPLRGINCAHRSRVGALWHPGAKAL